MHSSELCSLMSVQKSQQELTTDYPIFFRYGYTVEIICGPGNIGAREIVYSAAQSLFEFL